MIYVLDSDILSYFLKKNIIVQRKLESLIEGNNNYCIPPIVYYEVKRWLILRNAIKQIEIFDDLYHNSVKNEMTFEVWEKAIEIYIRLIRNGTPIGKDGKESDIFIGAFCIVNNYSLITNNINHYKNIEELKITNWNIEIK